MPFWCTILKCLSFIRTAEICLDAASAWLAVSLTPVRLCPWFSKRMDVVLTSVHFSWSVDRRASQLTGLTSTSQRRRSRFKPNLCTCVQTRSLRLVTTSCVQVLLPGWVSVRKQWKWSTKQLWGTNLNIKTTVFIPEGRILIKRWSCTRLLHSNTC